MTESLPFARTWLPYIYLYGAGGIIFLTGVYIVAKSGSLDLRRSKHKLWFGVLFFGFVWYLAIHGISTMAALGYKGIYFVVVVILLIGIGLYTLSPVFKSKVPWNR